MMYGKLYSLGRILCRILCCSLLNKCTCMSMYTVLLLFRCLFESMFVAHCREMYDGACRCVCVCVCVSQEMELHTSKVCTVCTAMWAVYTTKFPQLAESLMCYLYNDLSASPYIVCCCDSIRSPLYLCYDGLQSLLEVFTVTDVLICISDVEKFVFFTSTA